MSKNNKNKNNNQKVINENINTTVNEGTEKTEAVEETVVNNESNVEVSTEPTEKVVDIKEEDSKPSELEQTVNPKQEFVNPEIIEGEYINDTENCKHDAREYFILVGKKLSEKNKKKILERISRIDITYKVSEDNCIYVGPFDTKESLMSTRKILNRYGVSGLIVFDVEF